MIDPTFDQDDVEKSDKLFNDWDSDGDGKITKDEFINCCKNIFDNGRDEKVVALKYMKNKGQYDKERHSRDEMKEKDKSKFSRYILDLLSNYEINDESEYSKAIESHKLERSNVGFSSYPHCIVMPYVEIVTLIRFIEVKNQELILCGAI